VYVPVRPLGRGPSAAVDLARAPDGRLVALKRIPLAGSPAERATARQRLRREAEVLTSLAIDGIVPLIEVIDRDDEIVLVEPYLAGGSLADRVRADGPVPAGEVHRIARSLFPVLAHLHRAGVVHRDVTPGNVLFDDAGRPHLADFGIARTRDLTAGLTPVGHVVGTPSFIAPEQARGDAAVPATDIYALGATLRFALTGMPPHGIGDPATLARRAAAGTIEPLPPTTDPATRHLLDAMCRLDPADRPAAATLAAGVEGTTAVAVPPPLPRPAPVVPPPPPPPPPPVDRTGDGSGRHAPAGVTGSARRWPTWVAGGLAAAALLAVGFVLGTRLPAGGPVADDGRPPVVDTTGGGATGGDQAAAPTTSTTACAALPYQGCADERPAPNTDGTACLPGWFDHDGDPATGCEAPYDGIDDGTVLTGRLSGTIVPDGDVDRLLVPLDDRFQLFCDGVVRLTLTAPAGLALELTAFDDGRSVGSIRVAGGETGTLVLREPSCFGDDSTVLEVVIRAVAGRSAEPWTLERSGSW